MAERHLQMEKDYYVFNGVQGEDGKPLVGGPRVVEKKGNPQTDNPWKDVKGSQQGTFQLEVRQQVWLHGVYNFKHGFYPVCSIEENKSFHINRAVFNDCFTKVVTEDTGSDDDDGETGMATRRTTVRLPTTFSIVSLPSGSTLTRLIPMMRCSS